MDNRICNNDGIIRIRQHEIEYVMWVYADIVRPYIKKFLSEIFPGKLIIRELNQIDFTIPEENLPVEIQSTIIQQKYSNTRRLSISYASWESLIRNQIEQNIVCHGRCWFFFDSELLRGMRNAGRNMSINMDWFRKFMKEEKLKVFVVSHDGIIEEKMYRDFDFLSDVSQTCKVAAENDDMVLNRNKMKIFTNVVKGYGFVQDEIDKFDYDYKKYHDADKNDGSCKFLMRQNDERSKLYGNILYAMSNLPSINKLLDREYDRDHRDCKTKQRARFLGIFDVDGVSHSVITIFIDRFDICKYFPSYLRNKEIWDKLKGCNLNIRQFDNVISGKNDVINGLDYYFHDDDSTCNNNMEENICKESRLCTYGNKEIIDKCIDTNNNKIDCTKQSDISNAWS